MRSTGAIQTPDVRLGFEKTTPGSSFMGVEQLHRDVVRHRRIRVHRDVHEVETVEIRHVRAAVERSAIRDREEHVVMTRVGDSGAPPAERRLVDARQRFVRPGAGQIDLPFSPDRSRRCPVPRRAR
jgi:hypothetical protein